MVVVGWYFNNIGRHSWKFADDYTLNIMLMQKGMSCVYFYRICEEWLAEQIGVRYAVCSSTIEVVVALALRFLIVGWICALMLLLWQPRERRTQAIFKSFGSFLHNEFYCGRRYCLWWWWVVASEIYGGYMYYLNLLCDWTTIVEDWFYIYNIS